MRRNVWLHLLPVILVLTSLITPPPPARAEQVRAPAERLQHPVTSPAGGQRVVPQGIIVPAFRVNAATAESRVIAMDEQSAEYGFTGRITVAGKGTVKYRWVRSDGGGRDPCASSSSPGPKCSGWRPCSGSGTGLQE